VIRALPLVAALLLQPAAHAAVQHEDRTFYFGELHAHTGFSGDGGSTDLGNCEPGGCGNVADFFFTARYLADLDFAAITDHANGNSVIAPADWEAIIDLVNAAHDEPGGFLSLLGAELFITSADPAELGHKNVIFFGDEAVISAVPMQDVAAPGDPFDCDELWALAHALDASYGPLLMLPHHPAATVPMPTRWSCHDEQLAPAVEIYSTHGNSRDLPQHDSWDPLWAGATHGSSYNEGLALDLYALHLGIIGGTDFHDTWPGMICHTEIVNTDQPYGGSVTGVFLDTGQAFTRAGLHHALSSRHTLATTGPLWPVLYSLRDAHGNELGAAGDVVSPPPVDTTTLRVSFPPERDPYVQAVRLYDSNRQTIPFARIDAGLYELELGAVAAPWFGYPTVIINGGAWYPDQGVICDDGGDDALEHIWPSPIWIEDVDEVDDDGDGFSEADGDCDDHDPLVYPDAEEVCEGYVDENCDGSVDEGCGDDDDDSAGDDDDSGVGDDDSAGDDDDDVIGDDDDDGTPADDDDVTADPDGCECSTTAPPTIGLPPLVLGLALLMIRRL